MRQRFPGLKFGTEAVERVSVGRGAFCMDRSYTERSGGLYRSENAGMSSDKVSENLTRRKPKVS